MTDAITPTVGMRVWVDNSSRYTASGYWGVVAKITPSGLVDVMPESRPEAKATRFKKKGAWDGAPYRELGGGYSSWSRVPELVMGEDAENRAYAYNQGARLNRLQGRLSNLKLTGTPTADQMDRLSALLDQIDAIMKEAH